MARAGTAMARETTPSRQPISGAGGAETGSAPERPMNAPDVKPDVDGEADDDGRARGGYPVETANSEMPDRAQAGMNMFHLPITSAPYPAARRRKRLGGGGERGFQN